MIIPSFTAANVVVNTMNIRKREEKKIKKEETVEISSKINSNKESKIVNKIIVEYTDGSTNEINQGIALDILSKDEILVSKKNLNNKEDIRNLIKVLNILLNE